MTFPLFNLKLQKMSSKINTVQLSVRSCKFHIIDSSYFVIVDGGVTQSTKFPSVCVCLK